MAQGELPPGHSLIDSTFLRPSSWASLSLIAYFARLPITPSILYPAQVVVGHSYGSVASWEPFSRALAESCTCKVVGGVVGGSWLMV